MRMVSIVSLKQHELEQSFYCNHLFKDPIKLYKSLLQSCFGFTTQLAHQHSFGDSTVM